MLPVEAERVATVALSSDIVTCQIFADVIPKVDVRAEDTDQTEKEVRSVLEACADHDGAVLLPEEVLQQRY